MPASKSLKVEYPDLAAGPESSAFFISVALAMFRIQEIRESRDKEKRASP